MAVYPSYTQHFELSSVKRSSGLKVDRGGNQTLWIRRMSGTVVKPSWKIVHPALSLSEWNTLNQFYVDNLSSGFDLVWNQDKLTYSNCFFVDCPQIEATVGPRIFRVASLIEQR